MGIQEELGQLEYLSLVSKVCTELDNHLNMNDKTLAEFVIDLADKNRTMEGFRKALIENGADFSGGLMRSLFDLVTRMRSLAGSSSKVMEEAMAKAGFQKDTQSFSLTENSHIFIKFNIILRTFQRQQILKKRKNAKSSPVWQYQMILTERKHF